jgi:hypothetical protein
LVEDLVALDGGVAALHPLVLEDLLHLAFGDVALGQHDLAELLGGDAELLHLLLERRHSSTFSRVVKPSLIAIAPK